MMPLTDNVMNMANVDVAMAARQYVNAGWSLVPIAKGSKGPRHMGWNLPAQCIDDDKRANKICGGIGLAHLYSGTCCIDLDNLEQSRWWLFDEHSIDIDALLNAPDAVQIGSGRANRGKLLYRLPEGINTLVSVNVAECGLEMRCATRDGKTVQDVLPPTIHPGTQRPYTWAGAGDWQSLPTLPAEILVVWQALAANVEQARPGAGVADGNPDADPVAQHLDAGGWVKAKRRDGTRHITCPFAAEHTTHDAVGDCSYFPAMTGGFAQGHFKCLHSHCASRTDEAFLNGIKYDHLAVIAKEFQPIVDTETTDATTASTPDDTPWPGLLRDRHGRIEATVDNLFKSLCHEGMSQMRLGYDQFRDEIMCSTDGGQNWAPFKDVDYVTLRITLERRGFKPIGPELIRAVVARVAEDHRFDSAQQWLMTLAWDGVPRIDRFLPAYFNADDLPYARSIGAYTWTALAGRVMEPGCQADMVPVLIGKQGLRKSTGVKAMAPSSEFFCEINFAEKEPDNARKMRGRLVAEIGELRGLHTVEVERIKQFVTKTHEDWTPKFKEFNTVFARRLVFIGTSNQDEFLADETGNRRWLPIRVGRVDVEAIARDRLQLWAEGRDRFLIDGVAWSDAERLARDQHPAHMICDSWEEIVREWLDQLGADGVKNACREFLRINDVLRFALNFDAKNITRREELRVGRVLTAIGYAKRQVRVGNSNIKAWVDDRVPF